MIEEKKYQLQECQNEEINNAFRQLHYQLVNKIIEFCKNYDIKIDEFHLNGDGVLGSIPYGLWEPCTDSALTFIKYTDEYKNMSKKDLDLAINGKQTVLFSA